MKNFNINSRQINIARSSCVSVVCGILNTLFSFVYRALFIRILSVEYLGINGLFSGILTILSLSELGVTGAISYRFYKPISENDIKKVGELMNFVKKVYFVIATVITMMGLLISPFLSFFITDLSQVPEDINLLFVYLLFLIRTIVSYVYTYKQLLLTADQKQYIVSVMQCLINLLRYVGQIIVLFISHHYTYMLVIDILITIIMNYLLSLYIRRDYKEVFKVQNILPYTERTEIYNDTKANMFHKVGFVVLNGTDNLVLSKFAGLIVAGIYSNYAIILSGLNIVIGQLLGSFTASLGNASVELSINDNYRLYKRLLFVNMWITSLSTVCLFCLINPFINLWIGNGMTIDMFSVFCICMQYYLETIRKVSTSYINASGTFVYDKVRPLIEAGVNILASVFLVKRIGLAGVFLGTIISHIVTVTWREPFILYKYVFKRNVIEYWIYFFEFSLATVFMSIIFKVAIRGFSDWIHWMWNAIVILVLTNVILLCFFRKRIEFQYYVSLFKRFLCH